MKKETKVLKAKNISRNSYKEAKARARARRIRSLMRLGMDKESIEKMFAQEENRMILVLLNGKYTIEDGTKKKKIIKRDEHHKIVSSEEKEVPNILRGYDAARKYVENEKLHFMAGSKTAIWILSDINHVDEVVGKLNILGRVSITKPEKRTKNTEEARIKSEKKVSKPTNNTTEAKKSAKKDKKEVNKKQEYMRPYYAALRRGSINKRIKRHNPELAKKISLWIKERKKIEAKREENNNNHDNTRHLTTKERKKIERTNKNFDRFLKSFKKIRNNKESEKHVEHADKSCETRTKNSKKPKQTKIKFAA